MTQGPKQHDVTKRLISYGDAIKAKREIQKQNLDNSISEQFDFKPKINERSRTMATKKSQPKAGYESVASNEKLEMAQHQQSVHRTAVHDTTNPECSFIAPTNQTQMPDGDDDDLVDDMLTDRQVFPEAEAGALQEYQAQSHSYLHPVLEQQPVQVKPKKFMSLYDDAKSRELRQE